MPTLSFKKQFSEAVESGKKRQTIRALRKKPFKQGDTLYLYTGMRTKSCRKLGEALAKEVLPIEFDRDWFMLDGDKIYSEDVNDIAKKDGFRSFIEMLDWFDEVHGLPFVGQLIRW